MKVKKENNKLFFIGEISTLEQYFDLVWMFRKEKHPQLTSKKQVQFFALLKEKNELITLRYVRDNLSLKGRAIEHDVETENNLATGMTMLGMFSDDDKPLEPRWEYVGDYELIDIKGSLPIVKRKNEKN